MKSEIGWVGENKKVRKNRNKKKIKINWLKSVLDRDKKWLDLSVT